MPPARPAKPAKSSSKLPSRITSTAEFARYVGLARTTVSRVLNGQPGLKPKTIERVEKAMAETGFTPNAYALHLKGKSTAMIGVCMENLLTPPAVQKLASLQRHLRERGYASLIEVLDPGTGTKVVRHLLSMRVEGVVFIGHFQPVEIEQRIAELTGQGTPHLVIDQVGLAQANTVALDRPQAMIEVFEHLLGLGHRTFGLLGISGTTRSNQDRLRGIEAALKAHGLTLGDATHSFDHLHTRENDFSFGRQLAHRFAELRKRPTAYVALNDEIAIGALHGFQELGFKIPDDLSITGFNNQDVCEMTMPGLTSVDQQIEHTVTVAIDALFAQFGAAPRAMPLLRKIAPKLVVRGSTGRA
ncbi:MAG TPA: LacI family DNA-binding transcriptional regulator [Opitutaceae bacterium]